ncbi:MAG: hypothetical protein HKN74_09900 [Acidimicrobiia bacterium]|nr:hypothetical protein [Acidimicrobiia bacterium]NNF10586.1 hypothetical protein [Acidimicrobiia bacterium]
MTTLTSTTYRWFAPLWAGAVLFHLAGNPFNIKSWTTIGQLEAVMGLLALSLLIRPGQGRLAAMAAIHVPIVLLKAPVIGNHEMIEGFIHLAILGAMLHRGRDWMTVFVPAARAILIVAYGFIAFSKLNSDFLDPAVSCAVLFGDEIGRRIGMLVSDNAVLSNLVIWGTLAAEVTIPIALLRRWRNAVPFALAFHFVLALDPVNHVYDFSSTLLPLFLLFLPPEFETFAAARIRPLAGRVTRQPTLTLPLVVALIALLEVLVLVGDLRIWLVAYPIWLVVGVASLALAVAFRWESAGRVPGPLFGPLAPALIVVIALTALNGLAPYLEIKTAAGFNMYSNLLTAQGETNHLLVPGTFPLTDTQERLVEVVESDDPGLSYYAETGLLLTIPSVQTYLADHPNVTARVRIDGQVLEIGPDTIPPEVAGQPGWLEAKFGHFRALDLDGSKSCLRYWYAAH